ncbi:MAG: HYR domain-containing protein, partial [Bacteroidota bacterium]
GDQDEFIEIAGPAGTDLTGWKLDGYNGNDGTRYFQDFSLFGTIDDEGNGVGALSFSVGSIQNGAPDGIALSDDNGNLVEFISYEGSFVGVGGPADGVTSTDIGVDEQPAAPVGESLQRTGTGNQAGQFTWTGPLTDSPGDLNAGQTASVAGNVTLTVTDFNGNSSTCTATVTVRDVTPPTITCPANIIVPISDDVESVVNFPAPTAMDNCAGFSVIQTAGLVSGSTFQIGTTTNSFLVTDASGNTATCSFDVTILALPVMEIEDADGTPIANGDNTPSAAESTEFGSVDVSSLAQTVTFTIENTGVVAPLDLTGFPLVAISGDPAFTVSVQPATNLINAGSSTTFEVSFDPTSVGQVSAVISIAS